MSCGRSLSLLALGAALAATLWAASAAPTPPATRPVSPPAAPATPPRVGHFTLQFTERSPHSNYKSLYHRLQRDAALAVAPDYALTDESFEVYVPPKYDGTEPYGLLVWVSPGDLGTPIKSYLPLFDKHKLIWIGANKTGNQRHTAHRLGLALDAAHNLPRLYRLDGDRIYVSGASGGGRIASCLGLIWADVFSGSVPLIGCNFYLPLPVPDQPEKYWAVFFPRPEPAVLKRGKERCRYVLITGETDMNRPEMKACYEQGYLKEGYKFVTYIEVAKMGHTIPEATHYDHAIATLDAPLLQWRLAAATQAAPGQPALPGMGAGQPVSPTPAQAQAEFDKAKALLASDLLAGADALERVARRFAGTPAAEQARAELERLAADPVQGAKLKQLRSAQQAREKLSLAKSYLQAGRTSLARQQFEAVVRDHPGTPQAEEAKRLLGTLPPG